MNDCFPVKQPSDKEMQDRVCNGDPYILVLVDDWCPACQEYKPIIEYFAEKYERRMHFYIARPNDFQTAAKVFPLERVKCVPYTFFALGSTILSEVPGAIRFSHFESAVRSMIQTYCRSK